jgi:hypothetical protein
MAPTMSELHRMSDEELVVEHDRLSKDTGLGVQYCLGELARRDMERQGQIMLR